MYFWIIILAFLSTTVAVYRNRLILKEAIIALFIQPLLCNIILIALLGVGTIDRRIPIKFLIIYSVIDLLITYLMAVFISKYQPSWETLKTTYAKIWIALTPIFCFVLMERIFNPDFYFVMRIQYKIINIIILYIIFILTYYVLFPYRGTITIFYVVCMLFSTANYFVSIFRNGNSILPGELLALRTALNVSGSYIIEFTWELWKWLGIGLVMILISMKASGLLKKEKRIKARLFMGILTFAAIIGISKIQLREAPFNVIPDYWQPKTSYYTYGTPLTFLALCQNMKIEKPEGYDSAIAKEIYQEIEEKDEKTENSEVMPVKPTVIAIMNESLSDLGIIRKFNSDPDYLEFLHSFEEPEIQGNLLVPVYSGGTCNTEFEFLTGMSMGNLQKGVFPFQQ